MSKFTTGAIKEFIEQKRLMKPLWIAAPKFCQYSMAWRMGSGESYADKFRDWISQFSEEDQATYREMFPTPVGWYGWWSEELVDDPTFFSNDKLFTGFWDPTGSMRYSSDWLNKKLADHEALKIGLFKCDGTVRSIPSGWVLRSFTAPANNPEERFFSVLDYVLTCQSLFFDDDSLNKLVNKVLDEPERWNEFKNEIHLYTNEEWEKLLPGLLSLGFYYQISQNTDLRNMVLQETDQEVFLIDDETDLIFGGKLSDDGKALVGKNLLGFALMNACDEIHKIYKNVGFCRCSEE